MDAIDIVVKIAEILSPHIYIVTDRDAMYGAFDEIQNLLEEWRGAGDD